MTLALVSTPVFEASHTSIVIVVGLFLSALIVALMGVVRAYFILSKRRHEALLQARLVELKLRQEHLSASSELTVRRKGSPHTIKLPQHYTAHAADALLDLLAH